MSIKRKGIENAGREKLFELVSTTQAEYNRCLPKVNQNLECTRFETEEGRSVLKPKGMRTRKRIWRRKAAPRMHTSAAFSEINLALLRSLEAVCLQPKSRFRAQQKPRGAE